MDCAVGARVVSPDSELTAVHPRRVVSHGRRPIDGDRLALTAGGRREPRTDEERGRAERAGEVPGARSAKRARRLVGTNVTLALLAEDEGHDGGREYLPGSLVRQHGSDVSRITDQSACTNVEG